MKTLRHLHQRGSGWLQAMAACVIAPWLLAMAMAVSPQLHEHLHQDAGHADHECVVTHLQAGHFGDGVPVVEVAVLPEPARVVEPSARIGPVWVRPLYLNNGVLEHGPPVDLS